jgi:probable rRNA maturation factor
MSGARRAVPAPAVIDIGFDSRKPWVPSLSQLRHWAASAVPSSIRAWSVSVRIVGLRRSRSLNARYRRKPVPTNVLSFAGAGVDASGRHWLGELVICAPVLDREAREQRKDRRAHWAHVVVHGVLHLAGYDHERPGQARKMEVLETQILENMGFSNPYD